MYVFRIPERFYPYRFDLIGYSHNIHHFTVLIGAGIHFEANWRLFKARG